MTDYIPGLEDRLVAAARRHTARRRGAHPIRKAGSWFRFRRGGRTAGLAIGAVVLALGGAAVGAELVGEEPASLEERLPRIEGGTGPAVALSSGTAPDGARYEVVVYSFEGGLGGTCVGLEWPEEPDRPPRSGGGSGLCVEGSNPFVFQDRILAMQGRDPGEAAPVWLFTEQPGEDPLPPDAPGVLDGFTRPEVASLEVLFTDDAGEQHEAQVDHARVEGALVEELGLEEPFGYFVAFVPRETARSAEVIAHDADGEEIGRAVDRPPVVGEEPPMPPPDQARVNPDDG